MASKTQGLTGHSRVLAILMAVMMALAVFVTPSMSLGLDGSRTVYVSRTGSKYHYNPNCSGMKDPIAMTLEEAINKGKTPCKDCVREGGESDDNPSPDARTGFVDVSSSTAHYDDVAWLAERGITTGYVEPSGYKTFRPYADVARCDMAAFLYRLAGSPEFDPSTAEASFTDVDASTPHYKEVMWLAATGISKGWANGDGTYSFRPYATVARCDMAAFLYRLAGSPQIDASAAATTFVDVNATTPHYAEVEWLAANGVSAGWDRNDGTAEFRNYASVARCDMAAFMHRLSNTGLVAA